MIGNYLRKADQFLKDENFDAAERELRAALKEEPGNIYAKAYQERIDTARKQYIERKKREELQREEDEKFRLSQERIKIQKEVLQKPGRDGGAAPGRTAMRSPLLTQYEALLRKAWADGIPDEKKVRIIGDAQKEFNVSPEDHAAVEVEVKLEAYVVAAKAAWQQKKITPGSSSVFQDLRRRYGISIEQHLEIESRLVWELQGNKTEGTIMFIDDEPSMCEMMRVVLSDAGFKSVILNSPEQAIQQFKNVVPDLVICDMKFSNSRLDGLAIYDFMRKTPEFDTVPFIFLTGVKDEAILRRSLLSGVDEFLVKPVDTETLIASIEGKLKRYREIRKSKR
ncbi:MAG TPA: response regulator [Bacteroidota bacterium]|nr:response regulator [Bacteroidota bacterium]